jgi:hypothetical protein
MGTRKKLGPKSAESETEPPKAGRKTQKVNVWLAPEQIEWLKSDKSGASVVIRALITEAMNLDNLQKSVKRGTKKGSRK